MAYTDRFRLIPEVFLFLIKDGKILLLRRANTGWNDGNYGLVAGHAEEHEPMRIAMIREAKEEAGIDIKLEDLTLAHVMHRVSGGDHERIGFYFTVSNFEGEIRNAEPDKCDDLSWFPFDSLPENTIDHVRAAIDAYRAGIIYTEFNFPT